jgi:phosphoribosylaminoimidazolecarboxamide formyltransferase/IMP cyclohydrolase
MLAGGGAKVSQEDPEPGDQVSRRTALLATSDKRGVTDLARGLTELAWEVVATSGTAAFLRASGVPARDVSELTRLPTLLGGRLKTLDTSIFGGLLMRRGDPSDEAQERRHGFRRIDLLACTFYPFEDAATGRRDADPLELIDVGGPAMLRAAAKNHAFVLPLVSPDDYPSVVSALKDAAGDPAGVPGDLRRRLAARAFSASAVYDQSIASWLGAERSG